MSYCSQIPCLCSKQLQLPSIQYLRLRHPQILLAFPYFYTITITYYHYQTTPFYRVQQTHTWYTARYVGTYNPWALGSQSSNIFKVYILCTKQETHLQPSTINQATSFQVFDRSDFSSFQLDHPPLLLGRSTVQKTRLFIANLVKLRVYPMSFFPLRSSACLMRSHFAPGTLTFQIQPTVIQLPPLSYVYIHL